MEGGGTREQCGSNLGLKTMRGGEMGGGGTQIAVPQKCKRGAGWVGQGGGQGGGGGGGGQQRAVWEQQGCTGPFLGSTIGLMTRGGWGGPGRQGCIREGGKGGRWGGGTR